MSLRPRWALLGLVIAAAALAALPASAFAAGESIDVSPSNAQAGGSPTITETEVFAANDTPKTLVTSLPPGLLSNLNANPSCLTTQQLTASCQVGQATVDTSLSINETGALYLVPPAPNSGDIAGVQFVATTPLPESVSIGVSFNPSAPGGLNLTSTLPNPGSGIQITKFTATFNPTLNGQPFNRLPTSCAAATSSMTVTYYGSTPAGSASSSFTPTGCGNLAYSPNLTAAIAADSKGGAELKTSVTQAANESASKAITIAFPSGLTPNAGALIPCLNATGCTIGSATATSPLVPGTLTGTVTIAGTVFQPTLNISFPAPVNLTLTGAVSLSSNSVTFSDVPDVPLTDLTLDVTGVNGQRVFLTDCKPASVTGSFTAQGGQTHTATAPISYTGCPSSTGTGTGSGTGTGTGSSSGSSQKPKASGSITGLATGHPRLRIQVTDASAATITSVAVGLPAGLKFSHAAFVSHKVCTAKGKKKHCKNTTIIKGLRISGGSAKRVVLKSGRLVITLKKAVTRVTITAAGPLLIESKSLETKAKHHKVGTLRFTLKVTTANHRSTTLTLKLS